MALIVLAVIALIAALYFARAFVVPLLIGILASYTLRPVVDWLQMLRIPRPVAAALVLAVLVGGVSWIAYSLSEEATVMIEKLPDAARKLRQNLSSTPSTVPTALQNVREAANELQGVAADAAQKPGTRAAPAPAPDSTSWMRDYALAQSALLISVAAQTPIVLLLAYFLLASGNHFRRKLVQFVGPSLSRKKDALHILEEIDAQVQRYLFVMLASNALVGVSTWLAFEAMGVEQAGILGVFAGVMHFVPYLGTVLVAIAAGVAGFLQFGTLLHALAVAGVAILIAGAIGSVFMTWLQSRFARVNAAVLFIALLFFGWLWGVAGLLLGAPLVAIAKVICDRVDSLKPAGELLGR
jgi:predicted PurR-regulated permease PerM